MVNGSKIVLCNNRGREEKEEGKVFYAAPVGGVGRRGLFYAAPVDKEKRGEGGAFYAAPVGEGRREKGVGEGKTGPHCRILRPGFIQVNVLR